MRKYILVVLGTFLLYFFAGFLVNSLGINGLQIQSEDTLPTMFLPVTIIKEGTLYLDNYYDMLIQRYPHPDDIGLTPFYLKRAGNHYVSAFPILTSLLSLPVYFVGLGILKMAVTWESVILLSKISAGLIMAISSGVLFYVLLNTFRVDTKKSVILTIVYSFGTVNFAMLSQSLWQHGTVQLFLILGTNFLSHFLRTAKYRNIFLSTLFFGMAVLARPTALLVLGLVGIFLLISHIKEKAKLVYTFMWMLLGIIPVLLFFVWYNQTYYLSISNQGYSSQVFTQWLSPFPEGFLGTWISPSKGILIYSPILIFSLLGLWLARKDDNKRVYILFGLIILFHTLIMGFWKHWYGGYSFGYRMSSDILPFFVFAMVPYVNSSPFFKYYRLFIFLLCVSIMVQLSGLVFFDSIWHAAYDKGFRDTRWLWSLSDSEFMFNLRRILVKFAFLDKACPKCL
ncbi:hypothetical protein A3K34_02975 [candidate division WWE3 bacterium RIFOXYC1_FULL_40_10]|uniref:Glycosyltransferase RgtA/B/C/D-like domain-containing protein n=1 Tax=candidate division WWE3 bacterium RIFOXYA2_FULL_46_9 TaxID=1802636 RepID=A0A1F4W0M4_UNCKA|nr:MAG: hypothetical protein A3K58_02975 [candidate division WWE3 bacterium RIFOXYB1_FULL_40_22]OGC61810.1 MAG: hypothetical protein A3K37_02975 [candidate division WWE3 bacterium RIFOXYA1_FULL_40_11]OGC62828.1 MAG: hypothetical protein A2264_04135 [candidate division WWE3 bacterium RIFOXYA2_FULL_46_9]OGC64282.1 MAG: hypothetical protein A2326_00390 [candidate division WWE3 bacterium RIFOXYB2_FULL_41_6]OGC66193.1 MAG: hypothetical protein A3K34_02975 [candidate division WWE3 bacterium RIFOXYC1_